MRNARISKLVDWIVTYALTDGMNSGAPLR